MRVAFVADPHVGNHQLRGGPAPAGVNRRCAAVLSSLRAACERAAELDVDAFVVLGDLFDTARPSPQVLAATARAMCGSRTKVLVLGNHDRSSFAAGDHALGPLAFDERTIVAEAPLVYSDGREAVGLLPFREEPVAEWFERELADLRRQARPAHLVAVGAHFGLHDAAVRDRSFWARGARDAAAVEEVADVLARAEVPHLLVGNWHSRAAWTAPTAGPRGSHVTMTQVGALVPTGWDNPGLEGYGGLAVLDGGRVTVHQVPGPRFVDVRSLDELRAAARRAEQSGDDLYVRWVAPAGGAQAAREALAEFGAHPRVADADVVLDRDAAAEAARCAAGVARSAPNLRESAEGFLRSCPLPEGARRDVVAGYVRKFLRL